MSDPGISPSFDAHLRALGRLCITWAVLNRHLTNLASVLIGNGPEITAAIYSGNETLSPRCEAIKRLIVVRRLTPKWEEKLIALVEQIRTAIGPVRNRYVHDEWYDGHWGITRLDLRSSLETQKQPTKRRRVRSSQWHFGEAAKVEELSDEIELVTYQLSIAVIILSMHWHEKRPLRPFWRQRDLTDLRNQLRRGNRKIRR